MFISMRKALHLLTSQHLLILRRFSSMKFCINNYDCVGFDLDYTVVQYNTPALVEHEYNTLTKFLVDKKGYDASYLVQPIAKDCHLLQKGLFLDIEKGNILKLNADGSIYRAAHGTKYLDEDEIVSEYGNSRSWESGKILMQDPLQAWNGPLKEKVRPFLDYFDTPALLAMSRIIDSGHTDTRRVWSDVLSGLHHMFTYSHFQADPCGFFTPLRNNPDQFYYKVSNETLTWLKEIKQRKFTYLITGSFIDFVDVTAGYGIGKNWREYFDTVVCFAKKPGFFYDNRSFLKIEGTKQTVKTKVDMKGVYSQGNWAELYELMKKETKLDTPKCLYFGDNAIQDVYTPSRYKCCDAVGICAEMERFNTLTSDTWGDFFTGTDGQPSYWGNLFREKAKLCVPSLQVLAQKPLDHKFELACKI